MFNNIDLANEKTISTLMHLTILIMLCVTCLLMFSSVSDESDAQVNDVFTIGDLKYKVIAEGAVNEVEITECIDKSITVYDGVGSVEYNGRTFAVVSLGKMLFYHCESLTSAVIPVGVRSLMSSVFTGCISLRSVVIPEGVTFIGGDAFFNCRVLKSLTIPESVEDIKTNAFYHCEGLKELTLPISLDVVRETRTSIEYIHMWTGCENIEKITFTRGTGVGYDYGTGNLFNGHNHEYTPMYKSCNSLTTVVFEDGITHIGSHLLAGCKKLTSIIIPNTVTSLGNSAFEDCTGLVELTLAISLDASSSPGSGVWDGCKSIKKVTFTPGDGVGYDYGYGSAGGHNVSRAPWKISKDSLTTVIFEEGITHIGSYLLCECDKITSITIPETVISIGDSAFEDCTSLTDITLPDSVKDIGEDAFDGCPGYPSDRLYRSCKMDALVH